MQSQQISDSPAETKIVGAARTVGRTAQKRKLTYKRKKNKKNGAASKRVLWLGAPVVMLLLAVGAVFLFINQVAKLRVGDNAVQYIEGMCIPVADDAALVRKDDGTTTLMLGKRDAGMSLDAVVFYYTDRTAVLLPNDMLYYNPRQHSYARLQYFTMIELQGGNNVASREKQSAKLDLGFLYDGHDFYLFLEPVVVRFNDGSISLPAYSYAIVRAADTMTLFNYKSREFTMEVPQGNVEIQAQDYTIWALSDSLEHADASRELLFTRPELAQLLF